MSCEYFINKHPNCCECKQNTLINASESGRKYSLKNITGKSVCKIKIDSCVIQSGSDKKCDYLFLFCPNNVNDINKTVAFFIELKGQDLIQAIRQINKAITILSPQIKNYNSVNARVVLSKVNSPDIRSTELIRFKKNIKKIGGNVKYATRIMKESI